MANGLKEIATWRDSKGHIGKTAFYVASSGTAASQQTAADTVLTAIQAITNAAVQHTTGPATSLAGPVVYGTTADFATAEDKAVFTFSAADGSLHRYRIPAPKVDIFEVDTITVDADQTDAAAYITAVLANVVTSAGAALTIFLGGVRTRTKFQRKLSITDKVPELDEPAE